VSIRVLIVDDSSFFRKLLREILAQDPFLTVVGEATNGREAVALTQELGPDVVTMDVEMPVMNGISAVREIMARKPTPILMLSALTQEGANATFDALDAGAMDFFPKRTDNPEEHMQRSARVLRARLRTLAIRGVPSRVGRPVPPPPMAPRPAPASAPGATRGLPAAAPPVVPPPVAPKAAGGGEQTRGVIGRRGMVVIGASTGGPAALQQVLRKLPACFPVPLLVVQHMPAAFTAAFAQRLDGLLDLDVREAADGDPLRPGLIYIAPGGVHVEVRREGAGMVVRTRIPQPNEHYRPSVDIALASAAEVYGADLLGVVLTGMGDDGLQGARALKAQGGRLWAQDRATSVIYGMPAAVAKAGLTDVVLGLDELADSLPGCVR
jgi:two-component system chemotaxis response regulator CheB